MTCLLNPAHGGSRQRLPGRSNNTLANTSVVQDYHLLGAKSADDLRTLFEGHPADPRRQAAEEKEPRPVVTSPTMMAERLADPTRAPSGQRRTR
jgi:hypothetical protein